MINGNQIFLDTLNKCILILFILFFPLSTHSKTIIKDAEIEKLLSEYAADLYKIGLGAESQNIFIIPDQSIQVMQHDDIWIFTAADLVDSSSDLSLIEVTWYVNELVESKDQVYVLNSSNFSSGVHQLQLVITDDDGDQHSINLTIEIQSAPSIESSKNTTYAFLLIFS